MNPKVLKGEFIRYLIFCCYFCCCCSENSLKNRALSVRRDLFKGTDAEDPPPRCFTQRTRFGCSWLQGMCVPRCCRTSVLVHLCQPLPQRVTLLHSYPRMTIFCTSLNNTLAFIWQKRASAAQALKSQISLKLRLCPFARANPV